ncbi:MAG: DNA primase, partial [Ruminococcus sp.]|nr:DNA primase [Ruminococcus sp.]
MAQNDEFLTALKAVNPIESVIDSYVQLKKQGRVFVCNCPFHSENTPSFTVFPATQGFYCFGCQTGCDVVNFIMNAEILEF